LAWDCVLGEGGRGSFVGAFLKQEDLQKLNENENTMGPVS
jgi:hypothetical protein